jgi:hypothetical protein
MELTQASHQWSTRPSDQRFLNLNELLDRVSHVKDHSREAVVSTRRLQFQPANDDPRHGLVLAGTNGDAASLTHWSFGQMAALAKAPAGYLRTLPAPVAADCMNYGMRFERDAEDIGILISDVEYSNGPKMEVRAATGPNYGRIWNSDLTQARINKFGDGRTGDFRVPGEFGQEVDITRENTTIYGSDRDMFVFLADEKNRIEMKDRRNGESGSLARGFFTWNSEVGSQSVGAAFFLFDYVCMNRIVWGVREFKEMRLRHTSSAPDKWLEEIQPVLIEYANASAGPIEETIRLAQAKKLDTDLDVFLAKRFSGSQITAIKGAHEREEGRPIETLWDVTTGITAFAKTITFQDQRVAVERIGGKILDLVAA